MSENIIISHVTAVILAGGASTRMKSNKALLPYRGERFIERIHRQMASIFREIIVVTNTPETYRFLTCRTVPDLYPAMCSLAGIQTGLAHCGTPYIFVAGCDMPYLNEALIRQIVSLADENDVIIPESPGGLEPLHALYGKGCLPAMERNLSEGKRKIIDCFDGLKVTVVSCKEVTAIDPAFRSFRNINTPEEYFSMRKEDGKAVSAKKDDVQTGSR
jgi:molybdopterin-guanine dinucleotide biosynthesis protein A